MNRPPSRRSSRVAAGLVLAFAATLPAACGTATTNPRPGTATLPPKPVFSQKLHDMLPQSIRDQGFIQVGTDASYAPMESFGPDGRTIVGMDPDLGVEIGRVLGVRLQFAQTDFSELLGRVGRGNPDLGMSAMTDTPERAKTADFVNYFTAGTAIVVRRGNPSGVHQLNDLCGRLAAAESGTTQVDLLARTQKNCGTRPIIVKTYPTHSDALLQLRTGRAAAVLYDLPSAVFLVNDMRTKSHYQLASNTQYEPGLYGIVVSKSQPLLRDAVQGALQVLLRSGAYSAVLARWHVQSGAVQKITINSSR